VGVVVTVLTVDSDAVVNVVGVTVLSAKQAKYTGYYRWEVHRLLSMGITFICILDQRFRMTTKVTAVAHIDDQHR